jgi:hypothetical protein
LIAPRVVISGAVHQNLEAEPTVPDTLLVVERFELRLRGFDEERFCLWLVERSPHSEVRAG